MEQPTKMLPPCEVCKKKSPLCRNELYMCNDFREKFAAQWDETMVCLRKMWGCKRRGKSNEL